ncbi:MAG: arylamine N-acetyltransferase [Chloroflexota bacterium]
MDQKLSAYLERIGYQGEVRPDLETLTAVHRAHLMSIPYENLEIHRGGYLTVSADDAFQKIVVNGRGGWCYEMNGLLGWVLREIGFDVTLLGSTVNRQPTGKTIEGNHLILRVQLDKPYLADVGFGNGILEPIPLETGTYPQGFLNYKLRQDGEGWWFENHIYGGAGFDFTLEPHRLEDFKEQSHELQTWPESGFVRATVCQRFNADGYVSLRGAVLSRITQAGRQEQTIDNAADYEQVLANVFDLHLSDTDELWEKVWARHQAWVKEQGRA